MKYQVKYFTSYIEHSPLKTVLRKNIPEGDYEIRSFELRCPVHLKKWMNKDFKACRDSFESKSSSSG